MQLELHNKYMRRDNKQNKEEILKLFAEKRTWTLAQLNELLKNIDRSTIFRHLKKMLAENAIRIAHVHDKASHFELVSSNKHHDHMICKKCNSTKCIPCPVPKLKSHNLEIEDLCVSCKKK